MFGLFSGERTSSTYSTSRDEASDAAAGTCPHRHHRVLPNFSWGVAVRRDVRRQRFTSTAAVRRARKERDRHSFCCETLHGRHGGPTRVLHLQRHRVLQPYVHGLLQWSWNSSRGYGTVHATAEWTRRERDIASFQGWTRGATWSSTAVPGHLETAMWTT